MTNTSVRPGTAATAAFLLPAVGDAETIRLGGPALIELGNELDRLIAEWRHVHEDCEHKCEIWHAIADKEGVSPQNNDEPVAGSEDRLERYFEISRETGAHEAVDAEHAAYRRIDEINKLIRTIQPTTLAGLAVWAKATRFDCLTVDALAMPLEDADWDDECLIRFLAEVERMAGELS